MKAVSVSSSGDTPNQNWIDDLSRKLILSQFKRAQKGALVLYEGDDRFVFGSKDKGVCEAEIHVRNKSVYQQVLFGGTIGAGEAFMQDAWDSPNLTQVIEFFLLNEKELSNMDSRFSALNKYLFSALDLFRLNTVSGAKKNIRAHYDLNNEFFSLFLDESMMYSSAIFDKTNQSLESASANKIDHICRRLNLKPSDHLVEIGSGWGGLAIYAAKHYGCRVTTTTISNEQYLYAKEKVDSLGLSNQVEVLNKDYRLLDGTFDKLVSVEMIEAVGHRYLGQFFKKCNSLLKKDGMALIQAITTGDHRFDKEKNKVDFIRRYIFPGGCLPSNAVISSMLRKHTSMHCVGYEDITFHYAETLSHWRKRFLQALPEVSQLGFDDTFTRMWHFYLAYCEGGFRQRVIHTGQYVFAKPECRSLPKVY